jgi:hypothetical protein
VFSQLCALQVLDSVSCMPERLRQLHGWVGAGSALAREAHGITMRASAKLSLTGHGILDDSHKGQCACGGVSMRACGASFFLSFSPLLQTLSATGGDNNQRCCSASKPSQHFTLSIKRENVDL